MFLRNFQIEVLENDEHKCLDELDIIEVVFQQVNLEFDEMEQKI
jgi:hypothetical protein